LHIHNSRAIRESPLHHTDAKDEKFRSSLFKGSQVKGRALVASAEAKFFQRRFLVLFCGYSVKKERKRIPHIKPQRLFAMCVTEALLCSRRRSAKNFVYQFIEIKENSCNYGDPMI
jgi:hypothetical protein